MKIFPKDSKRTKSYAISMGFFVLFSSLDLNYKNKEIKMKILQKAFNNHIVNKIVDLGHKPATKPENEEARLNDLENLKIIEENISKSKRFSSFPPISSYFN